MVDCNSVVVTKMWIDFLSNMGEGLVTLFVLYVIYRFVFGKD